VDSAADLERDNADTGAAAGGGAPTGQADTGRSRARHPAAPGADGGGAQAPAAPPAKDAPARTGGGAPASKSARAAKDPAASRRTPAAPGGRTGRGALAPAAAVADDDAALGWAARVQRLETELAGLRRAMRGRALIEQAKGLLAGTLDCTPDAAFEHLSRLSQHENRRLVEVAARIMGTAVPAGLEDPEPDPAVEAGAFEPAVYVNAAPETGDRASAPQVGVAGLSAEARIRLQIVSTAVQSAQTVSELAERLLSEGVASLEADAVLIYVAEPDGALRMASCAGLPAQVASDWQRIPSPVPTVLGEAIASGAPLWFTGRDTHGYLLVGDGAARAALPLRHAGRTFGCLEPIWARPREFSPADRAYLEALANAVAKRIWQLDRLAADVLSAPGHWLQSALDAIAAPTLLLSPVRDDAGTVTDFTIDFASSESGRPYDQEPAELVGARLLDVRPTLAVSGVFDAYRQVLLTGTPWQRAARTETILVRGKPKQVLISRSAARLGDGLVASWQVHDAEAELARVAVVEELGKLGYAEWDRRTGQLRWSAGLYRIFDRSPSRGPLSLEQIPAHVVPEDLPALERKLRALVAGREPGETQFRIGTRTGAKALRVLIRPSYDEGGELTVVHAVAQDVTELALRADSARRDQQAAAMRRVHRGGRPGG
jgi:PAS domain-containing protein